MKFLLAIIAMNIGLFACVPVKREGSAAQSIFSLKTCFHQVGVPTREFEAKADPATRGRQRQDNWCAAACTQMILNYYNVNIMQEDVVRLIFGGLRDDGIRLSKLAAALDGQAVRVLDRDAWLVAKSGRFDSSAVIAALEQGKPVIVGLYNKFPTAGAHAQVLSAVSYHTAPLSSKKVIDFLTFRDPWGPVPSRQILEFEDFNQRVTSVLYLDVVYQ